MSNKNNNNKRERDIKDYRNKINLDSLIEKGRKVWPSKELERMWKDFIREKVCKDVENALVAGARGFNPAFSWMDARDVVKVAMFIGAPQWFIVRLVTGIPINSDEMSGKYRQTDKNYDRDFQAVIEVWKHVEEERRAADSGYVPRDMKEIYIELRNDLSRKRQVWQEKRNEARKKYEEALGEIDMLYQDWLDAVSPLHGIFKIESMSPADLATDELKKLELAYQLSQVEREIYIDIRKTILKEIKGDKLKEEWEKISRDDVLNKFRGFYYDKHKKQMVKPEGEAIGNRAAQRISEIVPRIISEGNRTSKGKSPAQGRTLHLPVSPRSDAGGGEEQA
jgi:hypothetical protein